MSTLENQLEKLKNDYRDLGSKYHNCQAKEMENYLVESEIMKRKIEDIEYFIFCNEREVIVK